MPKSPSPTPEHTPLGDRKKLLIYCSMVIVVAAVFTAIAIALMVRAPQNNITTESNIQVEGTIECLPHKGSGPHTLECAYGLRTDDSRYYGLKDTPEPITNFTIGTRVDVEGTLRTNPDSQYDTVGDIDVKNISR